MVQVLSDSLVFGTKSNGYSSQKGSYSPEYRTHYRSFLCCNYFSSDIKTNSWCAKLNGLNMFSKFEKRQTWIRVSQPKMQRINGLNSVEFRPVCEEMNALFQEEEGEFSANGSKKKLPVWGNVEIHPDSQSKTGSVDHTSVVSKGMVTVNENRVHFLEERNEERLSKRILELSRTNKVRSALELYRSMEYSGLRPNLHAFNSLLSCLLRNEMLDEALSIFEFMKGSGFATGHTYSLILKAIADYRGYDAAISMFEELKCKSKDFDAVVYNTILSVCGKANDWVQTRRIWAGMKENDHVGTSVTYRLLVCIFVRCGQNELALDAYHEMVRNGLKPGNDEMQAIIGASAKEGKWELGLSVFEDMLRTELKPSLIACNALINSLGKGGKVELAFKVYGLVKSLGHAPDAYTWNALLGALHRTNRHTDALQLFESIRKEEGSRLNIHVYNTTLMSCQKLGLWDRALQLLWQMEESELPVSTASYNLVIGACEMARKPKVALQVYEHMLDKKCSPDTFTLLSLIRGCIWGSLWDEVDEILNRAAPDASLYNAAIQGMCLRGNIDSAKKVYMEMPKKGLKPDGKTRAFMLQSFSGNSFRHGKR